MDTPVDIETSHQFSFDVADHEEVANREEEQEGEVFEFEIDPDEDTEVPESTDLIAVREKCGLHPSMPLKRQFIDHVSRVMKCSRMEGEYGSSGWVIDFEDEAYDRGLEIICHRDHRDRIRTRIAYTELSFKQVEVVNKLSSLYHVKHDCDPETEDEIEEPPAKKQKNEPTTMEDVTYIRNRLQRAMGNNEFEEGTADGGQVVTFRSWLHTYYIVICYKAKEDGTVGMTYRAAHLPEYPARVLDLLAKRYGIEHDDSLKATF
jgi:hypothetical protein